MKTATFLTLALCAGVTCPAGTLVQTQSFQLSIVDSTNLNILPSIVTRTLVFGQFDPSLGILTSVQFALTNSTATGTLTVSGSRNSGSVNSSSLGTFTGSGSAPGAPFLFVFTDGLSASCSGTPSCTSTQSEVLNPTGTLAVSPLSGYAGTGTISTILTLTAGRTVPVGTPLFAAGLARSANVSATWTGDVTLTYTYETPEPATWALAAFAGTVCVAGRLRRRSRRFLL